MRCHSCGGEVVETLDLDPALHGGPDGCGGPIVCCICREEHYGVPILCEPPPPTPEERAEMEAQQARRDDYRRRHQLALVWPSAELDRRIEEEKRDGLVPGRVGDP